MAGYASLVPFCPGGTEMLNRQMYGRASFELLRKRVLLTT